MSGERKFSFAFSFDIHPLVEGRKLKIGGVEIPFSKGALGHSDGDALLHALTDALLSASSLPDIGSLFPDSSPQFKNTESSLFLKEALELSEKKGFKVYQVDLTLVLDEPKLAPYYGLIKENIANLLKISPNFIGLKARTSEGLIFPPGQSAIMAFALVVLERS
ncbi:MAG: 2-C-methyl-D-erythritol 2,4-cyclodiphosphate synthase [Thermodesulfobacteriaceae bacterium]|nr:2-C-methyl-D-erythritol 2,4-cyclodiphosphate synthase [Thermodesulfobacteriaceae bacterium]